MASVFEKLAMPMNGAAVTPDDGNNLVNQGCLYVGGAGNVSLVTAGGSTITFTGVAAGTFIPLQVARVRSTNTTATNLLVLY